MESECTVAVLSDTHAERDTKLAGRAAAAVDSADVLVHAGDFITERVLNAFATATPRLVAVHGNRDIGSVCEGLPATETATVSARPVDGDTLETDLATDGVNADPAGTDTLRVVVVHGHDHTETALGLLARQEAADLVVVGHSHRPALTHVGDAVWLNPGSHADPRGGPRSHAELHHNGAGWSVELRTRAGRVTEAVSIREGRNGST